MTSCGRSFTGKMSGPGCPKIARLPFRHPVCYAPVFQEDWSLARPRGAWCCAGNLNLPRSTQL